MICDVEVVIGVGCGGKVLMTWSMARINKKSCLFSSVLAEVRFFFTMALPLVDRNYPSMNNIKTPHSEKIKPYITSRCKVISRNYLSGVTWNIRYFIII